MKEPNPSLVTSTRRRGYCPGVWTPMRSGDGLIVRVQTSIRPLGAAQLRELCRLADEFGNGLLELTRRANLQLRGVREDALAALQAELVAAGLAEASREREKQLAPLLVSPHAGLLAVGTHLDTLVAQLEQALTQADAPLTLPSKFSLVVDLDDGLLASTPADLRLLLRADACVDLRVAHDDLHDRLLGTCQLEHAAPAVMALLAPLEQAQQHGHTRMRDLVKARGLTSLRELIDPLLVPAPDEPTTPRDAPALMGFDRANQWFGLALPFGAGSAAAYRHVADLSERHGAGLLRVTPARTVVLPGVSSEQQQALERAARAVGLIVDVADPVLRAVACAGAPACGSALGETRALATELAHLIGPWLAPDEQLHVSGCEKSCARSGPARLTLLHTRAGVQLGIDADVAQTALSPVLSLETARQRLTAMVVDVRVPPPMTRHYEYEHDGAEIYRRSFAIIRSEAKLTRFASPIEERVAVRLIHTSGMVDLADDVLFSSGFGEAAAHAVRSGAPILCDANMIVSGVTRSRLSAKNDVLCFLDDPSVPGLAKEQGTTRSAAALTLWGERMNGAVVAIGNAPTALFRLLELLDETSVRPAAIIGLPVGFVGAAESKEALLADGRVPCMIVRGRRGGSAMTVAAINALASDKE